MTGLIHIYCGDGKGKTTAAVGLSIRCAGHGIPVLFTQFLKNGDSGELCILDTIPSVHVEKCPEKMGFTFQMDEEQKKAASACLSEYFGKIRHLSETGAYGLLILDEILDACGSGLLDEEVMADFLENRPDSLEVVLTGRNPSEKISGMADYISEIRKIKHPYDRGMAAREGIEY